MEVDRAVVAEAEKREKAAKAEKDARNALIEAYTIGSLSALKSTMDSFGLLQDNPAIQVLMDWIQLLVDRINAQFYDLAALVMDVLYGPNAQRQMERTEEKAKRVADALEKLVIQLDRIDTHLSKINPELSLWNGSLDNLEMILNNVGNVFDKLESIGGDVTRKFQDLYNILKKVKELLEKVT